MTLTEWETSLTTLNALKRRADWFGDVPALEFLKRIGLVPNEVTSMPLSRVRFNIDPMMVPIGYLASAAYEWDTWGPSHPHDFISAIEAELVPERRDFIAGLLSALGRTSQ